jgi:putative membrane protein
MNSTPLVSKKCKVRESVISMMGYGNGMMGWMGLWVILGLILLVAVVAMLAAWIVRRSLAAPAGAPRGGQEAGDVLRRRYASGEIDDEEFRRRLAVLKAP